MTTTGKVLIGGLALAGIGGAAYYFLVANKQQVQSLLPQASSSVQASASSSATTSNATAAPATPPPTPTVSPYEGKVIRADQEPAVYWIINGVRHGFLSPDALHRSGFDFPQVISVPKAIVMAIPEGSHISGFGLGGISTSRLR